MIDKDEQERLAKERARIKEFENSREKALSDAGKDFYEATMKADTDFEESPKRASEIYRKKMEQFRVDMETTIKQAHDNYAQQCKEAEAIYSNSPVKSREILSIAKAEARKKYENARKQIEGDFNKKV